LRFNGRTLWVRWSQSEIRYIPAGDKNFLAKAIDAALQEARAEGELKGWKDARNMADAILSNIK